MFLLSATVCFFICVCVFFFSLITVLSVLHLVRIKILYNRPPPIHNAVLYLNDEDKTGDGCYADGVVVQPMSDRLLTALNSIALWSQVESVDHRSSRNGAKRFKR